MNLLAIDTSTEIATVAILAQGEMLSEEQEGVRQHAQFLLPMVDRLLTLTGLALNQLDGIVFGRGPGSFTGLRVACSVAKGLAYAYDLPLFPVSSLAAIAHSVYRNKVGGALDAEVLAIIDARMHQVYWGCFSKTSYEVDEKVSFPSEIILASNDSLILAGVGFESYKNELPSDTQAKIIKEHTLYPQAIEMIHLVLGGYSKPVTAEEALPVYVRNQVAHVAVGGE